MANETTTSTLILVAAGVASQITPMFTPAAIGMNFVVPFGLAPNSKATALPIGGAVTASVVAEAGAITPATLTDTSVSLTIKKAVVSIKPTIESLRFAAGGQYDRLVRLCTQACVKKFEQDVMALATGFSQSVDSGASLTVAKTIEAGYLVKAGNMPNTAVLDAALSYGASQDVANDIRTNTGAFYGNPNFNPQEKAGVKQMTPGFMGQFFGINWWETGNHTTAGGNDEMMIVNREFAIAALFPDGVAPGFEVAVSDQVEFLNGNEVLRVLMWYQVAEYVDTAGVRVLADT